MGGLTIAWDTGAGPRTARLDVAAGVRPVAYVPEHRLATERARGLLPETVPHADAAANSGRAALLIAALTGRPELLLDATEDRLHQAYRAPAMPESAALVDRLRARGVPAVISGAGPTVLAFVSDGEGDSIASEVGTSWHIHPLNVDPHGACVQPIDQETRVSGE
jgi:homoserine kinase